MIWQNKVKFIIIAALALIACASTYPPRDFVIKLWKPSVEAQRAEHLNEETQEIEIIDFKDIKLEDLIMMTPEDYIKERKYQELLIKSCKEWR